MKNMFRITLYLFVSLTLSDICHADNKQENVEDISRQNDQIIKAAHKSGGLIFAMPPYWGRKNTQAGFSQLAKHMRRAIDNNLTLVVLKDYESMITRTMAGEVDIGFYGPSLYVKTKKRVIKAIVLVPVAVTNVEQFDYIGFRVLSDETYDRFRTVMELTR